MEHEIDIRVYYEDTDLAGVVYYANYLKFLERGRTEALRWLGIDQLKLKAEGVVFVVTKVEIAYRQPAKFDDLVRVRTRLAERRHARLAMDQWAMRGQTVLAEARVWLACMNPAGRPVRIPAEVGETLDRWAASG